MSETNETKHTPTPGVERRGVDTFADESLSFIRRHDLDGQQATFGGLVWGFLRALLECDRCPGTFRVPLDADRHPVSPLKDGEWCHLYCANCKGWWTKAEPKP